MKHMHFLDQIPFPYYWLAIVVLVIAVDSLVLRPRGRGLSSLFYFCFAFGCMGAIALLANVYALWLASEAKSWVLAEAVVTVAESSAWRTRFETVTSYDFRYRYSVDGVQYDGRRFWPAGGAGRKALSYAVGDEVEVFYDPVRPQRALLEPAYPLSRFLMMLVFSLFVMIPALSTTWSWWSERGDGGDESIARSR